MVVSILGLFFKTLAALSLFFLTKIVLAVHKNQKLHIKLVVGIVILFTFVKLSEDYMTGKLVLNISKL